MEASRTPEGVDALRALLDNMKTSFLANQETAESVAILSVLTLLNTSEAIACMAARNGMTWHDSYAWTAQTMAATAGLLSESGMHPAQLKDLLCEPGSAAIRALNALEHVQFRASLIDACFQAHDEIHASRASKEEVIR